MGVTVFRDMDAVRQHLKLGIMLPVYCVSGEDDFRKRGIVNRIDSLTTAGGTGFDSYHFLSPDAETVADAAFEITFGGGRRCVVAEDVPFGSMGEAEFSKFSELIKETAGLGGETVLVFSFFSVSTESKKKKSGDEKPEDGEQKEKRVNYFSKFEKLVDSVGGGVIHCSHATDSELVAMMEREAGKNRCTIDGDVALYMIKRCGNDSGLLKNEITKVSHHVGEGAITRADVDLMTAPSLDDSVFELTKRISSRDMDGAFSILSEFRERGEAPQLIVGILSSAYQDILRGRLARSEGYTYQRLMDDFPKEYPANRDWKAKNAISAAGRVSPGSVSRCFGILLDADMRMKSTGTDANLILDETVARLFAVK